jgi:murein DD-endopeptidase MepM/ murein hydrolase activator NlpD
MPLLDRLLTILVTATITSALWIVAGGSLIDHADSASQRERTRPAEAAPSPSPSVNDDGEAGIVPAEAAAAVHGSSPSKGPEKSPRPVLAVPVLNVRPADLTDTFSNADGDGIRLHEALDIMAPRGTTVIAAAPGTIEKLFASKAGGRTIYIRSPDRETIYYYAHLEKYAEGLREGQRVRRGQRLGSVGSSGNASDDAPHLHFAMMRTTQDAEWWEPANAVNPYPLLTGN